MRGALSTQAAWQGQGTGQNQSCSVAAPRPGPPRSRPHLHHTSRVGGMTAHTQQRLMRQALSRGISKYVMTSHWGLPGGETEAQESTLPKATCRGAEGPAHFNHSPGPQQPSSRGRGDAQGAGGKHWKLISDKAEQTSSQRECLGPVHPRAAWSPTLLSRAPAADTVLSKSLIRTQSPRNGVGTPLGPPVARVLSPPIAKPGSHTQNRDTSSSRV